MKPKPITWTRIEPGLYGASLPEGGATYGLLVQRDGAHVDWCVSLTGGDLADGRGRRPLAQGREIGTPPGWTWDVTTRLVHQAKIAAERAARKIAAHHSPEAVAQRVRKNRGRRLAIKANAAAIERWARERRRHRVRTPERDVVSRKLAWLRAVRGRLTEA